MCRPTQQEIDEVMAWLEEDARIHDEWAAWVASDEAREHTSKTADTAGDAEHHRKWAARYRKIQDVITRLNESEVANV